MRSFFGEKRLYLMQHIRHHAPDVDVLPVRDVEFGVGRVFRGKVCLAFLPQQTLHGEFAVQGCDDDAVMPSFFTSISQSVSA